MNMVFDQEIQRVTSELVHSRISDEGTVVTLSSIYPSGSPVQVRVSFDGNDCFVNDMGNGFAESEVMGATARLFTIQAREVAKDVGVSFDNHSFFAVRVPLERVAGAIKVVGSASLQAVVITQSKLTEQKERDARGDLLDRLTDVFGQKSVEKDFSMKGVSSHQWTFAGRVISGGKQVIFDSATNSPNSIFGTHTKFSDVKILENAPIGVVAVPSLVEFKADYRSLLQQAANLIEIGSESSVYSRLAAAG